MVIGYISIFNRISNTKPTLEHQKKTKKKLGRHIAGRQINIAIFLVSKKKKFFFLW